jgi:hypothetical protein
MRVITWHVAVTAAAFAWVAVAACVGEDPESTSTPAADANGPTPGEFLGPCNSAGQCNPGLVCLEGVCHNAPNGSDAASADAGTDGPPLVLDTWCLVGLAEAGSTQNPCPSSLSGSGSSSNGSTSSSGGTAPIDGICSGATRVCCLAGDNICSTSSAQCLSSDGGFAKPIECSGGDTCGSSQVCCLELTDAGTALDASTCPLTLTRGQIAGAFCNDGTTCGPGKLRICRTDADCSATAKCRRYEQRGDDPYVPLGVCF